MTGRVRTAILLVLVVGLAVGAFALYDLWNRRAGRGPAAGDPAPSVRLLEMRTGAWVRLPDDLEGQAFALIFFVHSCPACREEAIQLEYAKRQNPELRILFVAPGSIDDEAFFSATVHEAFFDPSVEAFAAYGVTTIPRTFFIDREGVIAEVRVGWTRDFYQLFVDTLQRLSAAGD